MENQNVRVAVSFILGLIVGVGGYWLAARPHAASDSAVLTDENATTTPEAMIVQGDNGLAVNDQKPGAAVVVSQVVFQKPGWVAIHDDVNGQPGKILGAKLFDTGKAEGAVVELLRNTVAGKSYIAMIHNDDGDYHHFTPATDKPLLDDKGAPIMVTFTVSDQATATATPEPTTTASDNTLNL